MRFLLGSVVFLGIGACNSDAECANSAERCDDDMVQVCDGGFWTDYTECTYTCGLAEGVAECEDANSEYVDAGDDDDDDDDDDN